MPVSRYETVGFHESGHDGAFQLEVVNLDDWTTLASRGRGTGSRTAADIVTRVDEPVMAPIDGTVIRAGSYTLYCDHTDNFVVIEPSKQNTCCQFAVSPKPAIYMNGTDFRCCTI